MPDFEDGLDLEEAQTQETEPVDEGVSEPEPQGFYDGKYKSREDFESAHKGLERKLGEQGEELRQYREYVQSQQSQQSQQTLQTPQQIDEEAFTDQFLSNPAPILQQYAQAMRQQALQEFSQVQAGIRRAVGAHKQDPLYAQVGDEFEAALMELAASNPQAVSNPVAVEYVYNAVAGKKAREVFGQVRQDPSKRLSMLESLGVSAPSADTTDTSGDGYGRAGQELLREKLGLGKEAAERARRRAAEREE